VERNNGERTEGMPKYIAGDNATKKVPVFHPVYFCHCKIEKEHHGDSIVIRSPSIE